MKKAISFEEWIDRQGIQWVMKKLNVTRFTVMGWKAHRNDPRVDTMRTIKRMTRGEIGYEQMIDRGTGDRGTRN
jgi:hypothetical protein